MIVGIDLGTTNSLVAVYRDGAPALIPNALGQVLTPSVVSVGDGGEILVGLAARDRLVSHPERTAAAFKRLMGVDKSLDLAGRSFRPEELSALVLGALKRDAEVFLGEAVTEAVITVPAYFNDLQRKATQNAGALAGLSVRRLLSEPTAAALAYGVGAGAADEAILVIDIGGGTFDVSLLHVFDGVMEVRATAGDIWLGGEDFVDVIVETFMAEVGKPAGLPPPSRLAAIHGALRRQAEGAKRRLSVANEAEISLVYQGETLTWTLDRARFEALCEPVLARVRLPIERALRDARVEPETLARVILAGGAARMPMFRRLIGRLFHRLPEQSIDPDTVVAIGAAVRAGMIARDANLDELILTDVAPFTLGIETSERSGDDKPVDGFFLPIIERGTVIPASRTQIVVNARDRQTGVRIKVYQGESRLVADNVFLGQLPVRFPRANAGEAEIEVRFTYDPSGLLEVESTVLSTGVRSVLVIEGNPGALSAAEVATRMKSLAALKVSPHEDAEVQALIARANRIYAQSLGGVRQRIGEALAEFITSLEKQDATLVRTESARLAQLLDRLDGPSWL